MQPVNERHDLPNMPKLLNSPNDGRTELRVLEVD
jgi:hypothetical protein